MPRRIGFRIVDRDDDDDDGEVRHIGQARWNRRRHDMSTSGAP